MSAAEIGPARGLLLDQFDRIRELVTGVTDDLGDEAASYRVDPDANPIGWLVWHLTRIQDDHIAGLAQVDQVWPAWRQRFALPFEADATGYGQSAAAVGQLRADGTLLAGYHADVHQRTRDYLHRLTDEELGRVVDTRWDPPVTVAIRLVSVIGDALQHLGQAAYVKGLAERRGRPLGPRLGCGALSVSANLSEPTPNYRFYGDLASWWPLLSAPQDYAEEAAFAASLLHTAVPPTRTVLELGSGGGNNAFHLKAHFAMTLVDVSAAMLAVSRELNPDCEHLQGDMRTVRLDRTFDAVFVHDAIEYMTSEDELAAALATVFVHCRPGGVAVLVPDDITENFEPSTEHGGRDLPDGRGARYLSWSTDPDPADATTITDYAFLLRAADGSVEVAHDRHTLGLFSRETWLRLLAGAGFTARSVAEVTTDDRLPREFFVGIRPSTSSGPR